MNNLKLETNDIKVDVSVSKDSTVVVLMQMLTSGRPVLIKQSVLDNIDSQEVTDKPKETMGKIVAEKEEKKVEKVCDKLTNNNEDESLYKQGEPPIWIVECGGCGDFVTTNILKKKDKSFHCGKCGADTPLSRDNIAKGNYTCECGTKHSVMIHSLANFVEVKCRECQAPMDLKYNEKTGIYEALNR